jgi:hypothetical protein
LFQLKKDITKSAIILQIFTKSVINGVSDIMPSGRRCGVLKSGICPRLDYAISVVMVSFP